MLKDEKVTFRLPAEMRKQLEQVAERYGLTLSNATLFVVACGLDTERDYRPVLYVANKVVKFAEKMGGLEDAETTASQE